MTLTVTTSSGTGYGKVTVNHEGNTRSPDDNKAFRRIGTFAIEYKQRTWKSPTQPGTRQEPNTPPTTADWSLTTQAGEQQFIATIINSLIAGKADALKEWNNQ